MTARSDIALGERPRVLVVDDDVVLRRVVRSALAHAGFDVAQVGNGRDALRWASAYDLDLIVTDLEMPGMSGLELLRALRAEHSDCPVVVMSGATDARASEILAAGGYAFLPKPFGVDELQRTARGAVYRRETVAPSSSVVPIRSVGNVA